jgi:glutamate:Na+ symporter, ESS family
MNLWDFPITIGQAMLDIALVSALLLFGLMCRRYVPFFQRFLIPSSLIAGFAGLILGPEMLGILRFDVDRMGAYLYHLLALTFIGIGLQGSHEKGSRGATHVGFIFIFCYLIQIIVGLGISFALAYTFMPILIPAVGMLLPLGFGMGPGIAYSIGQSWEAYGFVGGGDVGLSLAAMGFLVAYFVGVALVNRGVRAGASKLVAGGTSGMDEALRTGILRQEPLPIAGRLAYHGGTIEPLTVHFALIGGVYLLTYGITAGLGALMVIAGLEKETAMLWGFHFIIANLLALFVRRLLGREHRFIPIDAGLLHRLTGWMTDYMIALAVIAISMGAARTYSIPIILMTLVGTPATYYIIRWAVRRAFDDHPFERLVGIFGEMTGTISSGLALIRVTDPDFRTNVAQDLGLGSGMALVLGFPLLVLINLPFTLFDGEMIGYWFVFGVCAVYLALMVFIWKQFVLKKHHKAAE